MAVDDKSLPPPPIRTPVYMVSGQMHQAWVSWFNLLYKRVGGSYATPATDIDILEAFAEIQTSDAIEQLYDLRQAVEQLTVNPFSVSDLIKKIDSMMVHEFMRVDPQNRRYCEGDWTPAFTGLVVAGGSAAITGKYIRDGRWLEWEVLINPGSGVTTAATRGSTFINNLPYKAGRYGIMNAVDAVTKINISTGVIDSGTTNVYVPTWAATPNKIVLTGSVQVEG